MVKRFLLAVVAVFIAWSLLDFIIHGLVLKSTYEATASLWRPMEQMKMGVMHVATAVYALAFVAIYAALVTPKSMAASLKYGTLFGVATGVSMGFGSYSVMPIPLHLAVVWCVGALVEMIVAGAIVGAVIKEVASGTDNRT